MQASSGLDKEVPESLGRSPDSAIGDKPQIDANDRILRPEDFVKGLAESESAASATQAVAHGLCTWLGARGQQPELAASFGYRWGNFSLSEEAAVALSRESIKVEQSWNVGSTPSQIMRSWGESFRRIEHCGVKSWQFRLSSDRRTAWSRNHLVVMGVTKSGFRTELRLDVQFNFQASPWRISAIELLGGERLTAKRSTFLDVSAQVGVHQYRAHKTQTVIQNQVDVGSLETIGGLGVVDWNGDGRDDIFSWLRRRTLQVFLNDGQGGYRTILNPIPPASIGLAMLAVDLNGDGSKELVSTEIVGCEDNVGWLGLFERQDNTWVLRPEALRFPTECDDFQRARFQHVNVDDVDGDGDLDIFIAGFQRRRMPEGRQNVFHAHGGLGNLLFRNDGDFRFTERARALGFAGDSFSYGSTFFDFDRDGDSDLYVVNDYGPNQLYLNEGRAKFRKTSMPPLTENGQSMGITVADLSDDGRLDVYVSNMYSHAGNRIVPLVKDDFSPAQYESLVRLAQGNSLYVSGEGGAFEERGQSLGVSEAGWAWGQAVFDLENDGDWDVYVANGNTSNQDARAPDY